MTIEKKVELLEKRISELEKMTDQINDMLMDHGYGEGEEKSND